MTKFYSLGPQPKWYLVDNAGKPTAGFMYTYSSLNLVDYKPVYQDQSNNFPYPQPVPFAANGTAGPFYWEFDDANPDELYYLEFYDSNNNLLYTINNFTGDSGGGGGGSVTTAVNLKNYVGNNTFLYNVGSTATPVPNNTILAPSNHNAFIDPDIRFFNGTVGGTDIITFPEFTFGSNPLTGDVTPQYYLQYNCSIAGGETRKYLQFPIEPQVATLDSQEITVTIWARTTGGLGDEITIQVKQFFGTPTPLITPTSDVFTTIGSTITLNGTWTRYSVSGTIPGVSGATVSPTHDDALYLTIELPHALTSIIQLTKPSLYLGSLSPASDFNSQQQTEALLESPRTADTKNGMSYASYVPGGWIFMGDSTVPTIGDPSSGSTRANNDTWFLFNIIWTTTSNTACPIYDSSGISSSRGVSSQSDWEANKRLSLPNNIGSVISNIGNGHSTGENFGSETHTLSISEMPSHNHNSPVTLGGGVVAQTGIRFCSTNGTSNPLQINIPSQGGGAAHNIVQPTTYIPCIIKL